MLCLEIQCWVVEFDEFVSIKYDIGKDEIIGKGCLIERLVCVVVSYQFVDILWVYGVVELYVKVGDQEEDGISFDCVIQDMGQGYFGKDIQFKEYDEQVVVVLLEEVFIEYGEVFKVVGINDIIDDNIIGKNC